MGDRKSLEDVEKMADAAEYISIGDSINRQVRVNQDWSLLPNLGFASAIAPTMIIKGNLFYPRFPEWLGKNSS
jgi:replication factor C subunit 1